VDVYVARQAVLNVKKQTVAYELLFRENSENIFPQDVDSKTATSRLILNHHLNGGFEEVTAGKRALINFCGDGINDKLPLLIPPENVIIEILESTEPTAELLQACAKLSSKGYRLALDDFEYHTDWNPFFKYVRLIKFDLRAMSIEQVQEQLAHLKKAKHLKFLAEKVETLEDFERCKALGFEFFQGYFFCKPEMLEKKDISASENVVMAIITEIMKPQFSFEQLTKHFELDLSLTYKLLKFINSGLFQLREKVASIKQALVYLGEAEARKFITLVATAHLADKHPPELIRICIIRAKFCESIAFQSKTCCPESGFLLGLFSLIDTILNRSMDSIALSLPITDEIKEALLGFKNPLFQLLELVKSYESGSWYKTQKLANVVQVSEKALPNMYKEALAWADGYDKSTTELPTTEKNHKNKNRP